MAVIDQIVNQIRPMMKEQGYRFSKKYFYKIHNDIAYCLEFEKPGGLVYSAFYIMPLYIPSENRCYTYGSRISWRPPLGPLPASAQDSEIVNWCNALCSFLDRFVFPFFSRISSPLMLAKIIEENHYCLKPYFTCPPINIYRLQMFNYFYICDFQKLDEIVDEYTNIIQNSAFLTEGVRNGYIGEISTLERQISLGVQQCRDFCRSTIKETMQNCF